MTTYRLGTIGYGDAGSDFVKAALYVDGWEAAAVGGRNMDKAADLGKELNVPTATVDEMCADASINIIAATTPPGARMDDCYRVLDAGKHLIVEKPMALSVADCDALIARAEAQGVQLMLAHSTSFFPAAVKAKELITAGTIGKLLSIEEELHYNYFGPKRVGWQVNAAMSGGGVVMNPCTHMVNRIRYIAGCEVTAVSARVGYNKPEHPDIEGDVNALLLMEDGVRATVALNGYGTRQKLFGCTVKGTEGSISMEGWNALICRVTTGAGTQEHEGYAPSPPGAPVNLSYAYKLEMWKKALDAGATPISDGYNGRQNVAVCQAIHEASRKESTIKPL